MNTKQDITQRRDAAEQDSSPALIPPVDVTEDESGITLVADLPGASRETLALDVDGDTLTVEAPLALGTPDGLQPVYAEVRSGRYRRSFTLSRELDSTNIAASLRDGVLTLRIPKSEQARPRRVAVNAG